MKRAERRLACLLLRVYPPRFRREYGSEALHQLESDLVEAESSGRMGSFVTRVASLLDFAIAGFSERVASLGTGVVVRSQNRRSSFIGTMMQDLQFALRSFVKRPGFTVVAVSSLALGVGANTAIFSVANGVLFRPLPYDEPDRVVQVLGTREGELNLRNVWLAYPEIEDLRVASEAFEEVSAMPSEKRALSHSNLR